MSTPVTPVASAAGTVSLTPVRLGHAIGHAIIVVMASSSWSRAFLTAKHRNSNKCFAVIRLGAA